MHRRNAAKALEVYAFLKANGSRVMQFIPLVQRTGPPDAISADGAEPLSGLPNPLKPRPDPAAPVTTWSVLPEDFGAFFCRIFDHRLRCDAGRIFVMVYDWPLSILMDPGSPVCIFADT